MSDIYAEVQEIGIAEVLNQLAAEPYDDPWREIGSGEVRALLDGMISQKISMSEFSRISKNESRSPQSRRLQRAPDGFSNRHRLSDCSQHAWTV